VDKQTSTADLRLVSEVDHDEPHAALYF